MKHLSTLSLRVFASLLLATTLPAVSLTLPGDLAATEGNGSIFMGAFFGSNTIQVQIAESELLAQGLMPGFALSGMRLRLAGGAASNPSDITISDLEILLGQAVNAVSGMSTTFADNYTGGLLVHDGAHLFPANSMPGNGTPNAFGPAIPFSSNYVYQGGDLIVQIRRMPASAAMVIDASNSHAGVGTLYQGLVGVFASTAGTPTDMIPVMQFEYETPEPSSFGLVFAGLAAVAWRIRKR